MKRFVATIIACALAAGAPALAKTFIHDDAGMFGAQTISQLDARISNFNAQTGKEVVVQTVNDVTGQDVQTAAQNAFSQQQVNGVLIFIDKGDRKDWIVPDRAAVQAGWWTAQTSGSIASAMQAQLRTGDYDGGLSTAVNGALNVYRSHLGSLRSTQPSSANAGTYAQQTTPQGAPHISMFWWIIIALFGFFIIRSIMRAAAGPRSYGPPGAPGPGYGPGYGGGYGGFGGGGGFFSGLLGGLGGAFIGNELFGGRNAGMGAWGNQDPTAGGGAPGDAGGWQSDPGQAGSIGGGGGDWGGGGFGGGGGGDFSGGGGGDAGGGW